MPGATGGISVVISFISFFTLLEAFSKNSTSRISLEPQNTHLPSGGHDQQGIMNAESSKS